MVAILGLQRKASEVDLLPPLTDPLRIAALLLMLGVVGWGFGLSAALARCSARPVAMPPHPRLLAVVVALILALGSTYAYALVLDATGYIDYCDPVRNALLRAC